MMEAMTNEASPPREMAESLGFSPPESRSDQAPNRGNSRMSRPQVPSGDGPTTPKSKQRRSPTGNPAESFKAITELLRWAYGDRRERSDPPSTQGDSVSHASQKGPAFDATQWDEKTSTAFTAPGMQLGRFTLGQELGRGGFGIVYLALDTRLGRDVALKVPRPDRVQNAAIWSRFAREARLAASLDHEAIVPVLDAGLIGETFYLATAFQNGEPLSHWLTQFPKGVPAREAAQLTARLASGLAYAHRQGVLHRDLKPSNVLMVAPDELAEGRPEPNQRALPHPRITDFGLGTFHDEDESGTLTGFWLGTPPYMAPEQVLPDRGPADERADIYSLGAIFYELLTNRPIYSCGTIWELSVQLSRGEPPASPRQIRKEIPRDLETICLKCLDHSPDRRYASASALLDDLQRYLQGIPVLARPRPAWERLGLWIRRHPGRSGLIGGTVAVGLLIAGLIANHQAKLSASNNQLNLANRELKKIVATLEATMETLHNTELDKRHAAYAADLRLVDQELGAGRPELAQSILLRQRPAPGQADIREFAWRLLWARATRDYEVAPGRDFSWWNLQPLDFLPTAKQSAHLLSGEIRLSPRAIVSSGLGESARFDGHFKRFFIVGDDGLPMESLWLDDGHREIPLRLPPARSLVSPDGKTLALSNLEWVVSGSEAPALRPHPPDSNPTGPNAAAIASLRIVEIPACLGMNFSGDGRTLILQAHTPSSSILPILYDLESGRGTALGQQSYDPLIGLKIPGQVNMRDRGSQSKLVLSPDGRLAARTDWEPRVRVFDTQTGRDRWALDGKAFGSNSIPTCLAFSPDGKVLITGDSGGDVRVWDATNGEFRAKFPGNLGYISSVGWYPDARTAAILAGSEDAIRFWNYAPDPAPPDTLFHGVEVWDIAFLEGGTVLASAGDDHRIRYWNVSNARPLKALENLGSLVTSMADGGRDDHQLYWSNYTGQVGKSAIGGRAAKNEWVANPPLFHSATIRSLARSPDGRHLAAVSQPTSIWIRDTIEGTERIIETPHRGGLFVAAFSPDGRTLAVGGDDRSISIWNVPDLTRRAIIPTRGPVRCIAFSPDRSQFAAGDNEGRIQFWDARSMVLKSTVERGTETGGVWDLAFSPDGRTLASGGDDMTVRLWDAFSVRELLRLPGHSEKVHAVAFSPDGRTLASADFQGMILLHRTQAEPVRQPPK